MYLVKSLPSGEGVWQIHNVSAPFNPKESVGRKGQIHCVSTRPLVPKEGLYQIHAQSLNTHRGKHRSVGAQVPLFRFFVPGNMRTYPRSGFRSGGTSAKTTLLETTLLGTPDLLQTMVE